MSSRFFSLTFYEKIISLLFFCAVFIFFTQPVWLVSDFWWHLATGQWIVLNQQLLDFDPFLFSSTNEFFDPRKDVIYKGYWLAQAFYYYLVSYTGFTGALLFKALSLTLIFFIIRHHLLAKKVDAGLALALIAPLVVLAQPYAELRPQVFSFLGIVFLITVLERGFDQVLRGTTIIRSQLMCVPIIFLIWGQLHQAVIMGVAFLTLYFVWFTVRLDTLRTLRFFLLYIASLLAALANPVNLEVYRVMFNVGLWGAGDIAEMVGNNEEYGMTWSVLVARDEIFLLALLVGIAAFGALVLLVRWRRHDTFHLLLFLISLFIGFSSFRYAPIFAFLVPLLIAEKLAAVAFFSSPRCRRGAVVMAGLFILFFAQQSAARTVLRDNVTATTTIDGVVKYLEENDVQENIFNPYEWGGYLIWKFYPRYRFFMDARALDANVFHDYRAAAQGRKSTVFAKYDINTVVFYLIPPSAKQMPSIFYSLIKDDSWDLSYVDDYAVVFRKMHNVLPLALQKKSAFVDTLLINYLSKLAQSPENIDFLQTVGQLYYVKGDDARALSFFHKAREIDPDNVFSAQWVQFLRTRI
ncbi:MAG: hypothetical protein P1P74_12040 [Desulfuromonadales bacterium]|nr:hypothetical protein [Desulfuromonadales bacterium]